MSEYDFNIWYKTKDPVFSDISKKSLISLAEAATLTQKGYQGTMSLAPKKTNLSYYDAINPLPRQTLEEKINFLKIVEDYIRAKDFDATYKIAMHHGAVNTAKTDIGYQISNEHVGIDFFEGHDITLLGDIHKPAQFLDDAKTIAYPGSLIQQNHGEALIHGILVWDVEQRSAEFHEIHNEYGYVTIETQGATIVSAPARMPQRPRVRIKFNETSAADMKKLIAAIRKKYDVEDITIQRTIGTASTSTSSSLAIGNVRDVEYQNTLLTDYIDSNFPQATAEEVDAKIGRAHV